MSLLSTTAAVVPMPLLAPMPTTTPMASNTPATHIIPERGNQHHQLASSNSPVSQQQPIPSAPLKPNPISAPSAEQMAPPPVIVRQSAPSPSIQRKPTSVPSPQRKPLSTASSEPRRSGRSTKPISRFTYTHDKHSRTHNIPESSLASVDRVWSLSVHDMMNEHWALAYCKSKSNTNLYTYHQAMASPQRSEWIEAAKKEFHSLDKLGCWDEVPVTQVTSKIIPGTWVLRIKRAPNRTFKKFKGRYCIKGQII
eukprot:931201_1